jgi:hypothetical protein
VIASKPRVTGIQSQIATPPIVWNGWTNSVKIVVVIVIIEKPSANEVYAPIVRRSFCG